MSTASGSRENPIRPSLESAEPVEHHGASSSSSAGAVGSEGEGGTRDLPPVPVLEEEEEDDGRGEVRKPRPGRIPRNPTQQEIEEHLPLHIPYRDWCAICVKAAGIHDPHRAHKDTSEERLGTTVSLDYCFFGEDEAEGDWDDSSNGLKILIMHDDSTDVKWVTEMKHKGANEDVVSWVAQKLEAAGHSGTQITLKTDQEEAIVALKKAVATRRAAKTSMVESQVRVSKTNAKVERAVRKWREQFRKLKLELESKLGMRISQNHPMVPWMVTWAAEVTMKFEVKRSGRTGYEEITGHKVRHKVFGFGEFVHFKMATDRAALNKFDGEWQDGCFVGVESRSSEYLVISGEHVFKCPTIRRRAEGDNYRREAVNNIQADYWQYIRKGASTRKVEILRDDNLGLKVPPAEPREYVPRRLVLRRGDFEKHGFTAGCNECSRYQTGIGARGPHSSACRDRLEQALRESIEGRSRWEKADTRITNWMAYRANEADTQGTHNTSTGQGGEEASVQQRPPEDEGDSSLPPPPLVDEDVEEGGPDDKDEAVNDGPSSVMDVDALMEKPEEGDLEIMTKLLMNVDITEVYSPERVNKIAAKYKLKPGCSLDLTNGWDFTRKEHRRQAWKKITKEEPALLIGSPPCTMFSILQQLNLAMRAHDMEWVEKFRHKWKGVVQHIEFCIRFYRHQLSQGRHFLHEHPWSASSWRLEAMTSFMRDPRVICSKADQCMYGLLTHNEEGQETPARKPTGFLTSSWAIADEFALKCNGSHAHQHLMGGRARDVAIYPRGLTEAICKGMVKQKAFEKAGLATAGACRRGRLSNIIQAAGIEKRHNKEIPAHWVDEVHAEDMGQEEARLLSEGVHMLNETGGRLTAWDDVNKCELDVEGVKRARETEMKFFHELNAYTRCPRECVLKEGGKIIDLRWIDTNKGDITNPCYRSRLVAREFNRFKDNSLYVSTPPLEALRAIISHAATLDGEESKEIMVNDVSRAYFYAPVKRILFIELPAEDKEAKVGEVGRLNVCLYGTRDAAKGWQQALSEHLISLGFVRGKGFPALFHHPGRKVKTLVHGDDYCSAGPKASLDWMEGELAKQYQIKSHRINSSKGEGSELKVLNRVIRRTEEGYELEGDQRHGELVLEQLDINEMKGCMTPGVDVQDTDANERELSGVEAKQFRAIAARCLYMSLDRPEMQYAVKEACRETSAPTSGSWKKLQRIGQFIKERPRTIWRFGWQGKQPVMDVFGDSNWAGCKKTRKSTSGGAIKIGNHCIKTWSKTQGLIAKSSAEAELYAAVRAASEALGVQTMLEDLGEKIDARVHIDASAAKSIIEREGLDLVRHIEVGVLWLQEQELRRRSPLVNIYGKCNPADLMTKNLPQRELELHLNNLAIEFRTGRAEKALELHIVDEEMLMEEAAEKKKKEEKRRQGKKSQRLLGGSGRDVQTRAFKAKEGTFHADGRGCRRLSQSMVSNGHKADHRRSSGGWNSISQRRRVDCSRLCPPNSSSNLDGRNNISVAAGATRLDAHGRGATGGTTIAKLRCGAIDNNKVEMLGQLTITKFRCRSVRLEPRQTCLFGGNSTVVLTLTTSRCPPQT